MAEDIMRLGLESVDLTDLFSRLKDGLLPGFGPAKLSIFLKERSAGGLVTRLWTDGSQAPPTTAELARGFAGVVARTGENVLISGRMSVDSFQAEGFENPEIECSSWAGVSLMAGSRTIGVLCIHEIDDCGVVLSLGDEYLKEIGHPIAEAIERKLAEEALKESESRYRMLFDHAPDGIIIADDEGRMVDANVNMCRMLGYEHSEFIRLTPESIVEQRDIERIKTALAQIAEDSYYQGEWKFRHKNETLIPVDISATKMPDRRILAIVRDLSERRRAEAEKAQLAAEVSRQRERLNNIVANLPGIVWETTFLRGKGLNIGNFVSRHIETLLGYSVKEWLSTPDFWLSVVREDHRSTLNNALFTMKPDAEVVQLIPLIAKDGKTVWVESRSAAFADESGHLVGVRGVMIDITERKRSEEALVRSEERYRELVENAIDIIYTHDLDGNYRSINKAVERITGYTREEVLRMNMRQTIAPEYLEKARQMTAAKLAGQEVTAYDLDIVAKDGRRVSLEVNTKLVLENGKPIAVQGIARDVTERKLLEEKLRQSQKLEAIGLLAGGVSHDFNNLLTALNGYGELTLAKMASDDPLRHNIEEIIAIGERAASLTRQLLAFSRKQVLKPVVHNLNSVIAGMEKMLRRLVRENIEIGIDLQSGLSNIEADPTQLEQVILNLVVNAQDAMPNGGGLTIKTENVTYPRGGLSNPAGLRGDFVRMTVTDTGEGIDESIQERIFEPFFTTKDPSKGSGLGLSTVHGIVKQSGGEILLRNSNSQGTSFEILLPAITEKHEEPSNDPDDLTPRTGTETVLLVEDDVPVRRLVEEILSEKGYKVISAANAREALEVCETSTGKIDLLLTDLVMPGMSGTELVERVSRMRPAIRTIVMSGYVPDDASAKSLRDSAAAFIQKPFTADSLGRAVTKALDDAIGQSQA